MNNYLTFASIVVSWAILATHTRIQRSQLMLKQLVSILLLVFGWKRPHHTKISSPVFLEKEKKKTTYNLKHLKPKNSKYIKPNSFFENHLLFRGHTGKPLGVIATFPFSKFKTLILSILLSFPLQNPRALWHLSHRLCHHLVLAYH